MADVNEMSLPDVSEPKVGPERIVHEKSVSFFDMKAFMTLLVSGIICGVLMWIAFSFVGGNVDLEALFGAVIGGAVSGIAIYALTGG